jgi:hypothetical protein
VRTITCVLFVALAPGCLQPAKYRLQLAGNPQREATQACYTRCRAEPGDARYACLTRCPGAVMTTGTSCAPEDRPPAALCENRRVLNGTMTTFAILGGIAVMIAATAVFAASLDFDLGPREE